MKYAAMTAGPFAFFRGTCHLFWEDWWHPPALDAAPLTWACGDLHLENFGTFKGDDRLTHFDLDDFDEAALAPCTWDAVRLTTSIMLAGKELGSGAQRRRLAEAFVDAYAGALVDGRPRAVERQTATDMVAELLEGLRKRTRLSLLNRRTRRVGGRRKISVDGEHALDATAQERKKVERILKELPHDRRREQGFYEVLDVERRVSGLGSLGIERYVVLVEGKGSPDRNYLLDLKGARESALVPALAHHPRFPNEAERVVAVQKRMQAVSPALLHALSAPDGSFILRELGAREDRVRLKSARGKVGPLEGVVCTMGQVLAWDQLRSSGRQRAARADDLIATGREGRWRKPLLDYARRYALQVESDYRQFCQAVHDGFFARQCGR